MASTNLIAVANETHATSSRITKEGRKIVYKMTVIQQPERARACGSGAKSSADRRPVDPPPIVDLRIFEVTNGVEADITFQYNANFFLFATLENARPLAPGRAPAPSQPAFPVLTGTPVSGMAYLDRPSPAGYFLFPDLSVRHEGKYRLAFSLYEELKESKDLDTETPQNSEVQKSAHVSQRLSVKSIPFTVFSAKKFPGLSESTTLSKLVAEQGCRVRIRRDVRMRRRETKGGNDYDNYDEEHSYERTRASATPDVFVKPHPGSTPQMAMNDLDRPRSVSNASVTSHVTGRRPSVEHQMNQPYQQPAPQQFSSPMTPHTPQGMYPPQMAPQWQQPAPVSYMQAPPQYPQQYQPPPPMNGQYNSFAPPQYPSYEQQNNQMRHGSVDYPAPPTGPPPPIPASQPLAYPSSSQPMAPFGQVDNYNRPMHAPIQPVQHNGRPAMQAPMQTQYAHQSPSEPKHDSISPYHHQQVPPVQAPEQHGYYTGAPVAPPRLHSMVQSTGATKRTYSGTFDTTHMDQPLRQGARPTASPIEPKFNNMDDDEAQNTSYEEGAMPMSYRRADGTERRRALPAF